jgi:2-dehydro-3-deoxygalactonokinase
VLGVQTLMREGGLACLPGSHSKWVRVKGGQITSFTTHMTGEAFAALRGHTILGRMMRDGPLDGAPFDAGIERSGQAGGLLHHLFGVRALGLADRLKDQEAPAYLSGILIGHEIRAALEQSDGAVIQVVGAPDLTALYGEAAARGLALIAEHAQWN